MAVEWRYLDHGSELGPYTSDQLRNLAGQGIVVPLTPVQRVSSSDTSPWKRAGEVKGLFSGDVSGLLGGPICGQCGSTLVEGRCPKCTHFDTLIAESIASVQPTVAPPHSSSPAPSYTAACPHCSHQFKTPAVPKGQQMTCPNCQSMFSFITRKQLEGQAAWQILVAGFSIIIGIFFLARGCVFLDLANRL